MTQKQEHQAGVNHFIQGLEGGLDPQNAALNLIATLHEKNPKVAEDKIASDIAALASAVSDVAEQWRLASLNRSQRTLNEDELNEAIIQLKLAAQIMRDLNDRISLHPKAPDTGL